MGMKSARSRGMIDDHILRIFPALRSSLLYSAQVSSARSVRSVDKLRHIIEVDLIGKRTEPQPPSRPAKVRRQNRFDVGNIQ